jgi:hypothetical protein
MRYTELLLLLIRNETESYWSSRATGIVCVFPRSTRWFFVLYFANWHPGMFFRAWSCAPHEFALPYPHGYPDQRGRMQNQKILTPSK